MTVKYMVYEDKVSKVQILEDKPGSYKIVAKGNEILCVPVEAGALFFDNEADACSYLCGGWFVPMSN